MGFLRLVGDDTNTAEGSSGEGVDSTYSNLIKLSCQNQDKFAVFFWCRHCSLLSGVSVESPCPSLLRAWEYCCYSKIRPRGVWSCALPSYNCNFLIVFMICFILPGNFLAPFWPSRTYLGFFFGLIFLQTAGVGWQSIYFAHRSVSQLCGFLHWGRLYN